MTLKQIIADYRARRGCRDEELGPFRRSDFTTALRRAALAQRPDGKRFKHQNRITSRALDSALRRLMAMANRLRRAKTFEHLHCIVCEATNDVPGIGKLYCYDTALRIGAVRGVMPTKVYLHAGTLQGAKKLGLDTKADALPRNVLPALLAKLPAFQIEDILCMYKRWL